MTIYAYLRVSTKGQTTDNQRLKIADVFQVDEWLTEPAGTSGSIRALERPVFSSLAEQAQAGDTVIAVSLDRLGRDTEDVLHTIRKFHEQGVKLRLMDLDGVDLTSQTGKMLVTLLSLVAEMERDKCIARTAAGVARAKDEGKVFGRYLSISPEIFVKLEAAKAAGDTFRAMADNFSINKDTIYQTLKKWEGRATEYRVVWNKQQVQKAEKGQPHQE